MANVLPDGTPCWWTTTEDKALREVYPTQGLAAVMALLPARSERAIRQRASTLGLHLPRRSRTGVAKVVYANTPETDATLRQGVPACQTVADARALAASMGRPLTWLRRRCQQLGLQLPRKQIKPWCRDEDALLETHAHLSAPELEKLLRRSGFSRSASAIALRLRRTSIDRTDPDSHTLPDLAQLLGVSPQTVLVWTQRHGLRAKTKRTDTGQPGHRLRVHRKDLRTWLRDNPARVNLARVDAPWFLDLALGAPAT